MVARIVWRDKVRFSVVIVPDKSEIVLILNNGKLYIINHNTYRRYLDRLNKYDYAQLDLLILK